MIETQSSARQSSKRPRHALAHAVWPLLALTCSIHPAQAASAIPSPKDRWTEACSAMRNATVPANAFGLPTGPATVATAQWQEGEGGKIAHCEITGQIAAKAPNDPPIRFQLNLPRDWNGKAVQFGGAGFNGFVVTGLSPGPGDKPGDPLPLARGYATYGSDSGHSGGGFDGRFGLNPQAMANYSGESVKRTHDAAVALIHRYYQKAPRRVYYAGGSKGGHEGLVAAQRYAADFDGVISFYPAARNQSMVLAWYGMWQAAYSRPGAALNGNKQALLHKAVLKACDGLDGAVDGIVANTQACNAAFAVNQLRCPQGADAGDDCLSDRQIDTLQAAASVLRFPFPMSHGVTSIGPFPVLQGAGLNGFLFDPSGSGEGKGAMYWRFAEQVIPYFDAGKPDFSVSDFNMRDFQPRVQEISAMFDASSPDLDAFHRRNGKMILVQGTIDMLVPPSLTTHWVETLRARYGAALPGFLRYYVQPGYGHGQGEFVLGWNALDALDMWVESGKAPDTPVAVDTRADHHGRTMPLCEEPRYPHFSGHGSMNEASSYTCRLP